jgi:hypothetical protein
MLCSTEQRQPGRSHLGRSHALACALMCLALLVFPAQHLPAAIFGGEGNDPIHDPGWPQGAAAIVNHPARIAWWEGPPFGGGQWHAECRGDAQALNAVLALFAQLDVKTKRVVVHDGVGRSFWLNPNNEPAKEPAARVDWIFMVWLPQSWEHLSKLPADLNPTEQRDRNIGPPSQIDVFVGGNIRWTDVTMPAGLEVVDERLEAHGFAATDGTVLEGTVTEVATGQGLAATVVLQHVEPQDKGGYRYTTVREATAAANGRWTVKNAPAGWYRVVAQSEGYVPRVLGYATFDEQPRWHGYDAALARVAHVAGQVTDDAGKPLVNVDVRLDSVTASDGGRYESVHEYTAPTDAQGRFRIEPVPAGNATVVVHKPGYCRPGLGEPITTPADQVDMKMTPAAQVRITVDFGGKDRPAGYIVELEPEGGSQVGKWSGSGNIDTKNQIEFHDIPPGRYTLWGQPNPGSETQRTKPLPLDLRGGATVDITLPAR